MIEELDIRERRIDEAAGQANSDSQMTSFNVIMPLKQLWNYQLWKPNCKICFLRLVSDKKSGRVHNIDISYLPIW